MVRASTAQLPLLDIRNPASEIQHPLNYPTMKRLLLGAIAGALLCTPALAQQTPGNAGNNFGAQNGNQNGAVLELPPSVQSVVSIDAFNMIIIASDGELPGQTRYTPAIIKHVYSGGIARLFGGFSVPTAQFVSPGNLNGNGLGNNGQGNNGNQNGGFGGNQNGGFGGNQNGGFGGFGGGGFQNGGGFGGIGLRNGALTGNGFDTAGSNSLVNARVQAR